jgi:hypothetical protein
VLLAEALEVIARLARQERYDRLQLQAAGTSVETHQEEVSSIAARTRVTGALKTKAVWCDQPLQELEVALLRVGASVESLLDDRQPVQVTRGSNDAT